MAGRSRWDIRLRALGRASPRRWFMNCGAKDIQRAGSAGWRRCASLAGWAWPWKLKWREPLHRAAGRRGSVSEHLQEWQSGVEPPHSQKNDTAFTLPAAGLGWEIKYIALQRRTSAAEAARA